MKYKLYIDGSDQGREIREEFDKRGLDYVLLYSREIAIEGDYFTMKGYDNIRRYLFPKKTTP